VPLITRRCFSSGIGTAVAEVVVVESPIVVVVDVDGGATAPDVAVIAVMGAKSVDAGSGAKAPVEQAPRNAVSAIKPIKRRN
jgi:hypothetical protein